MIKRQKSLWRLIVPIAFILSVPTEIFASPSKRPNILLIMAEDMSHRVGAFGDPVAITPNLDELASRSLLYPNTFTTAGVCSPSRAAQILGRHQISTGTQHMRAKAFKESSYRSVPPPNIKAYPELLRRAGYHTFVMNKLDYQFSDVFVKSGPFSIWDYEGSNEYWNGRSNGQPFFGFVTYYETHESKIFPKAVEKNNASRDYDRRVLPNEVTVPPYYPDHPIIRNDLANHYNNIQEMDRLVGALLDRLDRDGLADDTIVIWTTDHGDGLPRAKRELYDSGIRVPLIVHWPDKYKPESFSSTGVDNRLVSFVDIGPSVLAMAGVEAPSYMQGSAQLALTGTPEREYIYASKDRLDEFNFRERAIRSKQFKYIKNLMPNKPGATHLKYRDQMPMMMEMWRQFESNTLNESQSAWFKDRPEDELYDVINDPYEVKNLAYNPQYASALSQLKQDLGGWRQSMKDYSDIPELEMAQNFWPNGKRPRTAPPLLEVRDTNIVKINPAQEHDSVDYRINGGKWKLYSEPFISEGASTIEARAVRYGWAASKKVRLKLE
mgnify:FL=1